MTTRILALLLAAGLLGTLCACAVVSTDGREADPNAAFGMPDAVPGPEEIVIPEVSGPFSRQYATEAEARTAYEACKHMSYAEYFSEPRPILSCFEHFRRVEPSETDPAKLVFSDEPSVVYFDAHKYREDAETIRGGFAGDGIVDYFVVDDREIWRWHIPSDTVDVVVRHDGLYGVIGKGNDIICCYVHNDRSGGLPDKPGHYHLLSQGLAVPYADVPDELFAPDEIFDWFEKRRRAEG